MLEDRVEGEDLVKRIEGYLTVNTEYREIVDASDADRVAAIRRAGRIAGKNIGRKVRSLRSRPQDGEVIVFVCVADLTDEEYGRLERQAVEAVAEWSKRQREG